MVILIRYMVILIWSRYCVLNIPPCQARPVIALSQNHLFYIQYTFDICTMSNGCSVKPHINHQNQHFIWYCHKLNWEWISSGFAHKSSKERDWEKCNGLWSKHCKPHEREFIKLYKVTKSKQQMLTLDWLLWHCLLCDCLNICNIIKYKDYRKVLTEWYGQEWRALVTLIRHTAISDLT